MAFFSFETDSHVVQASMESTILLPQAPQYCKDWYHHPIKHRFFNKDKQSWDWGDGLMYEFLLYKHEDQCRVPPAPVKS